MTPKRRAKVVETELMTQCVTRERERERENSLRDVEFKLTVEMINNQHNKQVSDSLNEK